ncbi:MAG: hypothetical protein ACRBCI_11500 [Cellvibrionaceae bacterium]
MNKINQHLLISLFITIITGCASTTGPVTVRESAPASATQTQSLPDYSSSNEQENSQQKIALAQPVVPDSQQKNTIPLVERLVTQSNNALNLKNYSSAINLAERGLRIDRKEARLYLALAEGYQGLQNKKQSVYFAKQGLRYASNKEGNTYKQLRLLSQ